MQFARVATKQGIVGRRQLASWGFEHLRYRLRGTTDERTADVLKVARELIAGVPAKTIERMGPEVMAAILPRVYPEMLDEVHAHQDAGRPAFIVSAAGNDVVESLAQVLGMEGGIGTRYEVDAEGNFTGRLDGPFVYGPGKVRRWRASPPSTGSTWPSPTPTRTRSRTCRCCARSATRSRSTRTRRWPRSPRPRAGRRCASNASAGASSRSRFTVLATLAGLGASRVAARRRPPPRRFPAARPGRR